jgi:hypothetical protein
MRDVLLATACLALLAGSPAHALEKRSRAMDHDRNEVWSATTTVTIRYYNLCTGWIWVWSGWAPGEETGVCLNFPFNSGLGATWALAFTPQPSGYGFTGTISVRDRCDCTGNVLASQPWLPISGWTAHAWNIGVSRSFLIDIVWAAPAGFTNGSAIASDHPATGPTGPQSCGICFPSTRVVRSKYFGVGGANCTGVPLNDYVCDVEFLVDFGLKGVVRADEISWGQVKNLYR